MYRAELDLRKAVEHDLEARGWSESAIEQFLGEELAEPATVEGFVGRDGLIRKIVVTSNSGGFRETQSLELSDFGVRVAVKAPSARTVVDSSWLEG